MRRLLFAAAIAVAAAMPIATASPAEAASSCRAGVISGTKQTYAYCQNGPGLVRVKAFCSGAGWMYGSWVSAPAGTSYVTCPWWTTNGVVTYQTSP